MPAATWPSKEATGCRIIGPRADAARIPGIDTEVGEGDEFQLGGHPVRVYDTPGHTRGHIVYYLPRDGVAFVGDTLFAMGCGRLFEGTPQQMWTSLQKLMSWPDDTAGLLRPRIHPGQRAVRAHGGAGQCCAVAAGA